MKLLTLGTALYAISIVSAHAQALVVPTYDTSQVVTQAQLNAAQASNASAYATQSQVNASQAAAVATAAALAASTYVTPGAVAALAPVQSVNTKTGALTIPTLCRQQSTALAIPTTNPGSVSWTFPNTSCTFSSSPSCWMDITTTTTGFAFDYPLNTARSTTGVTYSFTSHANTLSILALGALSVSLGAPANSTVVMTCTAPPA